MRGQGRATAVVYSVFVVGTLSLFDFRWNKESLGANRLQFPCSLVASSVEDGVPGPLAWRYRRSPKRWLIAGPVTGPPKKCCGALLVHQTAIG